MDRRTVLRRTGAAALGVTTLSGTALAGGCPRSPGFWATHDWCSFPALAGSGALDLGCETSEPAYTFLGRAETVEDLRAFLLEPPRGDKGAILARQLIATVLNFNRRPSDDPGCVDRPLDLSAFGLPRTTVRCVKQAAERWLRASDYPDTQRRWVDVTATLFVGCGVDDFTGTGSVEVGGEPLKNVLDAYNNNRLAVNCDCGDGDDDTDRDVPGSGPPGRVGAIRIG